MEQALKYIDVPGDLSPPRPEEGTDSLGMDQEWARDTKLMRKRRAKRCDTELGAAQRWQKERSASASCTPTVRHTRPTHPPVTPLRSLRSFIMPLIGHLTPCVTCRAGPTRTHNVAWPTMQAGKQRSMAAVGFKEQQAKEQQAGRARDAAGALRHVR